MSKNDLFSFVPLGKGFIYRTKKNIFKLFTTTPLGSLGNFTLARVPKTKIWSKETLDKVKIYDFSSFNHFNRLLR